MIPKPQSGSSTLQGEAVMPTVPTGHGKKHNRGRVLVQAITVLVAGMLLQGVGFADTAQVLPKGRAAATLTYYHYFDINERFNPDGDSESIATDFNADLNSAIFPALAALDRFVVGGNASIGRSVVDITLIYRWFETSLYYGLTDKLSVGVLLPIYYSKVDVRARLDTTTANVGKNVARNTLAPLAVPGTTPLTTEDTQALLGRGLDINGDGTLEIPGFGYDRFETWSGTGLGDLEVLAKYQLYNKTPWRLAFTGGVRLPTGRVDDPDNLVDAQFGDGQTDLLLRAYADFLGIPRLLLNLTLRYDIQLPDKQEKRVLLDVNNPLTRDKEKVERDLGDIFEVELFGSYAFTKLLSAGAKYRFTKKLSKDDVDGKQGFNYAALEEETNFSGHMIFATFALSTTQLYQERKFPVPLSFTVEYRNRFAGTNNVTNSEYISVSLTAFF
jgi:hypothetical protein